MMAEMGWKPRLAIVLSFLWFGFAVAISASEQQNSIGIFVALGVLPLSFAWGIAWVWWGFRNRQIIPANELHEVKGSSKINTKEKMFAPKNEISVGSNIAENLTIENRAGFVVRLFRGDISLPITYWVFGFLIGNVILRIILEIIEFNYIDIFSTQIGNWSAIGFYCFVVAYSIFTLIAIWRSAGKYQGKPVWATLARAGVVLGGLAFIGNFVIGLQQGGDSDLALSEEVKMINKSLPSQIDSETSLDHVSIQDKDIYYNYTLVNQLADDMDISRFTFTMTPKLKTAQCANETTRPMLNEGRKLVYMYRDKASQPVAKIVVEKSDCM